MICEYMFLFPLKNLARKGLTYAVHTSQELYTQFALWYVLLSLQWRYNERDGVSNHRRLYCLLNRLFMRRSKNTSKLRVTGLCEAIHRWPPDSLHRGPVTRKMFPIDDVIIGLVPVNSTRMLQGYFTDILIGRPQHICMSMMFNDI